MIDSTEQNDDGPYSFYREVDEIFIRKGELGKYRKII